MRISLHVLSSSLLKNHLIAENLNEVKSSSLQKLFFKSLEKSAKCRQKISCGQTDESKRLMYRHILKPVTKVHKEKFSFLCFFSLAAIRHTDPPGIPQKHNINAIYINQAAFLFPVPGVMNMLG